MTIEEKRQAIGRYCDKQLDSGDCDMCPLYDFAESCLENDEVIDRNYAILFSDPEPTIKDSGNRREFESGAVRDMGEEKGRCDLLPLDILSVQLGNQTLHELECFKYDGSVTTLYEVLERNAFELFGRPETMFLELAKHFSEGAKKYGIDNWKKGIPVWCYIDSAVRHYLKLLRGDKDEPHDRAFVWNIVCAIWTCENLPELNGYAKEGECNA